MSHRSVRSTRTALMLAALFALPAGPALGQSVMLKREFKPGQVSYIESRMVLDQDISGLPMPPMRFLVDQLYGVWETVESAAEGKTRLVLTYDRSARKVEMPPMGETQFDTDDPEHEEAAPQIGAVLQPMIGMAMTMEVDQNGKVTSFSGMDAINKKISEQAVASMHWYQMKEEFTNERGQEFWGTQPLLIYPNKEVKVGDTWEASTSMERPEIGTLVTDYRYKVGRIGLENGRKVVSISVAGLVSAGPDPAGETGEDVPKTEVTGSLCGIALYDVELGRIVDNTTEGKVDMRIPLSKLMPDVPTGDEPKFATFILGVKQTTRVLSEEDRKAEKVEARAKAELRRKAEEEEDDEDEDDEE